MKIEETCIFSPYSSHTDSYLGSKDGDSGQSAILNDRNASLIDLQSALDKYHIWDVKKSIDEQDELSLAVNERMAYVFFINEKIIFSEIISELKKDERIRFIAWKEDDVNHVVAAGREEKLTFSLDGVYTDSYNQSWALNGAISVLDLTINEQNEIQYGDYPDALARLDGALHSHEGSFIVVDAKLGYEFIGNYSPTHVGGGGHGHGHGSLHKDDSLTPLIIVGTENKPQHNRLLDFKSWILELIVKTRRLKVFRQGRGGHSKLKDLLKASISMGKNIKINLKGVRLQLQKQQSSKVEASNRQAY